MTPRTLRKPAALTFLVALAISGAPACAERDDAITVPLPKASNGPVAQATAEALIAIGDTGAGVRVVSYQNGRSTASASSSISMSAAATSEPSSSPSTEPTSEPTASASSAPTSEPPATEPTASASAEPAPAPTTAPTTEPAPSSTAITPPAGPTGGELGATCTWNTDCSSNKCWWKVCTSRAIGSSCTFDDECDSQSCGWDKKCRSRGNGSSCVFDKDCNSGSCVADVCASKPAS